VGWMVTIDGLGISEDKAMESPHSRATACRAGKNPVVPCGAS